MTEEQIKLNLEDNERRMMLCVCDTLRNYGKKTIVYLADFVSSLCNVDKEMMFDGSDQLDAIQARWLFWYAYRYMTNETYVKIGELSEKMHGRKFTKMGVSRGINKMSMLIETEAIWKKRWSIIKRVIKSQNEMVAEPPIPITIKVPKNVEVTIKRE